MSDLAATNCGCDCGCGCDSGCSTGCGCNNNCGCNNGCGTSLFGNGGNSCSCILWIICLMCCCGNNSGCGCNNNGCNDSCWIIILLLLLCGNGCGCRSFEKAEVISSAFSAAVFLLPPVSVFSLPDISDLSHKKNFHQ